MVDFVRGGERERSDDGSSDGGGGGGGGSARCGLHVVFALERVDQGCLPPAGDGRLMIMMTAGRGVG